MRLDLSGGTRAQKTPPPKEKIENTSGGGRYLTSPLLAPNGLFSIAPPFAALVLAKAVFRHLVKISHFINSISY